MYGNRRDYLNHLEIINSFGPVMPAPVVRTAEKSDCKQQQSVVFFEYCNGAL